MTPLAIIVIAAHTPFGILLLSDGFAMVNRWADAFEARFLPRWFQWDHSGDPVSWLHHGLVTAGAAAYGAIWGWVLPDPAAVGAVVGASVACVAYLVREGLSAHRSWRAGRPFVWTYPLPHRVGWAVDGIMDVAVPGLVLAGCVWWAL